MKLILIFLNKDTKSFWKTWNSKFRESPNNSTFIDGQGDSFNIAKSFSDYFVNIYVVSSLDSNAVDEFNRLYKSHNTQVVASMPVVDVESIEKCINLLKCNKSAGHDGIFAEHLLNSHPSIVTHLKILFHLILSHAHVPASFGKGVVIPIIKDKHGALSSMENYRPITLSPIISKVFESFLLELYSKFLPSDLLQFGFKKSLGCSNAIFILRQVIDYFNSRRSNVYIASLDASKAFDRINHFKLFSTLCNKGVPIVFINVIINWYGKLTNVVRWNGHYSPPFNVNSGVRQGSLLSPILFNAYVDIFINRLRQAGLGCRLHNMYVGVILYADDMLLISASIIDLQLMLDHCGLIGDGLGMKFNSSKCKCIVVGPNSISHKATLTLKEKHILWVDEIKYLGLWLSSNKCFKINLNETRRNFFVSVNCSLSKCKYTCDMVKLQLMESHCLPILMYALESLNIKQSEVKEINSWWNSVYRKIFGYNKWESVRTLICHLGRLDILHMLTLRRICFIKSSLLNNHNNEILKEAVKVYLCKGEFREVLCMYHSDLTWSISKLKAKMHIAFQIECGLSHSSLIT